MWNLIPGFTAEHRGRPGPAELRRQPVEERPSWCRFGECGTRLRPRLDRPGTIEAGVGGEFGGECIDGQRSAAAVCVPIRCRQTLRERLDVRVRQVAVQEHLEPAVARCGRRRDSDLCGRGAGGEMEHASAQREQCRVGEQREVRLEVEHPIDRLDRQLGLTECLGACPQRPYVLAQPAAAHRSRRRLRRVEDVAEILVLEFGGRPSGHRLDDPLHEVEIERRSAAEPAQESVRLVEPCLVRPEFGEQLAEGLFDQSAVDRPKSRTLHPWQHLGDPGSGIAGGSVPDIEPVVEQPLTTRRRGDRPCLEQPDRAALDRPLDVERAAERRFQLECQPGQRARHRRRQVELVDGVTLDHEHLGSASARDQRLAQPLDQLDPQRPGPRRVDREQDPRLVREQHRHDQRRHRQVVLVDTSETPIRTDTRVPQRRPAGANRHEQIAGRHVEAGAILPGERGRPFVFCRRRGTHGDRPAAGDPVGERADRDGDIDRHRRTLERLIDLALPSRCFRSRRNRFRAEPIEQRCEIAIGDEPPVRIRRHDTASRHRRSDRQQAVQHRRLAPDERRVGPAAVEHDGQGSVRGHLSRHGHRRARRDRHSRRGQRAATWIRR